MTVYRNELTFRTSLYLLVAGAGQLFMADTSVHSADARTVQSSAPTGGGSAAAFLELFSLRRTRNAIYILAFFAGFALAAWRLHSLFMDRQRIVDEARTTAAIRAQSAVSYVERTMDVADLLAERVRDHIGQAGGLTAINPQDLQSFLADSSHRTAMQDFITVVNAQGVPVAASEWKQAPRVSLADRGWFKAHLGGAESYAGEAVKSRLGRNIIYTYSKRIVGADGSFQGAVDVAIQAQSVHNPALRPPGTAIVQLWTWDGRLVISNYMRFDAHNNPLPQAVPFHTLPAADSGYMQTGDKDLIIVYRKAAGRPLVATVTLKRSEILRPWDRDTEFSAALFVVVLLAGGLLARFATDLADADQRARKSLEDTANALSAAVTQRDLLLKEIHHRVKNNLQLTSSLIQMQARQFDNTSVRDAFSRTQQRVFAIGMIHDVLYNDDANAAVDVRGYLERLAAQISRADEADKRGIKTKLDIAPVDLVPEQATPLGLIASEVLDNAYKHAFPEEGGGQVTVTVKEDSGEVELTIADNGTGYAPATESPKSLGSRLIQTLTLQLHGTSGYTQENGTTFRLRFKRTAARPLLNPKL
ncbi:MAG TPA: histidine kinase dimerization/phosphoacceptor domain -containing protein [Rhizomicrobium sp.]